MTAPLTLEAAQERLFALATPLAAEMIAVDDAAGRHLARELEARRTQPARDLSVMDGFAVAGPGPWRIIGESRAGAPFAGSLGAGSAVRISTGAACPAGTGAILVREDAEVRGTTLATLSGVGFHQDDRWIRRRGFDFAAGDPLLAAGTLIGPAQIALARAAGHGHLEVARRPLVAVIECGDELAADPSDPHPDRIPASNGAMVAAMVRSVGGRVSRIGPLPDDRAELALAISEAANADVIVTTAGASVGEHDHVGGALADRGAELAFWRVAIRPGRPLLVTRLGRQIVLGLPGNPASSYVTAFLFLLPLLRALQGAAQHLPAAVRLPLAAPLPDGGERREFWRARFTDAGVEPLPERDSSALRTLAAADILIDRPAGAPAAAPGELVICHWLPSGGSA